MENVNHPAHYKQGGLEVIDIIDAFTEQCEGKEAFYVGNVLKYICRYKKKNGVTDLKKAEWYLQRLISIEEDKISSVIAEWGGGYDICVENKQDDILQTN